MTEGRTPQETTADMWKSGYWKQSKMAFLVASLVGAAEAGAWRPQRRVRSSPQHASVCPAASAASGPEQAARGSLSEQGSKDTIPSPPMWLRNGAGAVLPGV